MQENKTSHQQDDEISLVDLFLTLFRWKKLAIGVFLACLLGGLGYALSTTHAQNYQSLIEIGSYPSGGEMKILAPPDEVVTHLREATLPPVSRELAQNWGIDVQEVPGIEIGRPEESPGRLVWMRSRISMNAPQEEKKRVEELHETIIQRVKDMHQDILDRYKERFEARLEQKSIELKDLKEERVERKQNLEHALEQVKSEIEQLSAQRKRFKEKLSRIDEREEFLKQREDMFQGMFFDLQPLESDILKETEKDSPLALGLLLRGSLNFELQEELTRIQERLLDLEEQRIDMRGTLEENRHNLRSAEREFSERSLALEEFESRFKREIARNEQDLRQMRTQEREFTPTTAIFTASPGEIERAGRTLIVALSAVLGAMLGLFSPLVAAFVSTARVEAQRRQKTEEEA